MRDHRQGMVTEQLDSPTCTFHPDRPTLLSCTRCERPACPECLTSASVGMHCRECVGEQKSQETAVARELTRHQRSARRPGWTFWAMLGAFAVLCAVLATLGIDDYPTIANGTRLLSFLVVILGWLISLTLHEWAHAYAAYRFGDHSVVGRGYLTLDIRRYTDPMMSIVLPVAFLMLGGIPLPGGAVWIDHGNIRTRQQRSIVSAAGPAANIVFGIVCILAVRSGIFGDALALELTITYLGFLQFLAAAINLLPIPGLDGFGIISPYLPYTAQAMAAQFGMFAIIGLFIVLWNVPEAASFLWNLADSSVEALGVDPLLAEIGRYISDIRELGGT